MKNILFTMSDMNLNGAVLSFVNFLNFLDYTKYNVEILIIKKHDDNIINSLPKTVKVSYLYKDNPIFDIGFFQGLKKIFKENKKEYLGAFLVNKLFKYNNTKLIKKLKISLRRVYVPDMIYDVGVNFDGQTVKYLRKVNAKKKIIRFAYGKIENPSDPNNKPYNFCDYVVALCEDLKKSLSDKNRVDIHKIRVIHNVFDNDKIIEKSKEFEYKKTCKYLFSTCARIVPIKRIDLIPLVCEKLIEKGIKDFKWIVIGEPEKEKYLDPVLENIKSTNTKDYIEFVGAQLNPFPYLKYSDIYIHLSQVESWGRTITEALILKIPVLTTKTSGGKEQIISGNNGELCEIDDVNDITNKIIYMINNIHKYKVDFKAYNEDIMNKYYELFEA